ncbi:hypothetical protein [Burkholderia gladioli]|uniref:hypothetical protein n=1 Tax=Burkholderia gladioli TaxID=28095 RepID=UPI0016415E57|nr:hypothetical protein [Burkholderia gladioli]
MAESPKGGKLVSARVPQEPFLTYADLMASAGLSVSEGVRTHIQQVAASYEQLDLDSLQIDCAFRWREARQAHFPEHAGDVRVSVTSGASLRGTDLARIVFEIPEFFEDQEEPFRIDSFHFHRVNNDRSTATSSRVHRNVLSFRLIQGVWRAGVFDYGDIGNVALEVAIRSAVVDRIRRTIGCFMLGYLPETRLLSVDELERLNSSIMPHMLDDADR